MDKIHENLYEGCRGRGSKGGILLFWDKRKLDLVEVETCLFSITCWFKNVEDGFQCLWPGRKEQKGNVLGSVGVIERPMGGALVHRR